MNELGTLIQQLREADALTAGQRILIGLLRENLADLRGELLRPEPGETLTRLPLGNASVIVSWSYEAGEEPRKYSPGDPEGVVIGSAYINGMWVDTEYLADSVSMGWIEVLTEQVQAGRDANAMDALTQRDGAIA